MKVDNDKSEDLFKTIEFNPNQIKAEVPKEVIKSEEKDEDLNKQENKNRKPMTKKQKIIIASLSVGVVILLGVLIYYLFAKNVTEKEKPQDDDKIVVEKDNYKYSDGTLVFLNSEDEEIGKYECVNKNVDLCYVAFETNDDEFSISKKVYEDGSNIRIRSKIYQGKYVFIYDRASEDTELIFLYDLKENKKIDNYISIKTYSSSSFTNDESNYVFAKNSEGNYGVLDLNSSELKTIIDYKYSYLGKIIENKTEDDKLIVASEIKGEQTKHSIIDYKGTSISKSVDYPIKGYSDSHLVVLNNDSKYDVYDYTGTMLFGNFDYAKLFSDYLITVKDKVFNLSDLEGFTLLSEGIELVKDSFDPIITYDADYAKLSEERSYKVILNNNTLNIVVYRDNNETTEQTISLTEGLLSKNLSKYAYYGKKLYFYNDDAKTELLGTYECVNENVISGDTTELNNCKIASDTPNDDNDYVYEKLGSMNSLVFFNRYVFVYDSPTLVSDDTKEIYIVDLKNKKKQGPYSEVKFENGVRNNSLTDYLTTYIIVKSAGKYGVVSLTSNKASNLIDASFEKIDFANNNFITYKDGEYAIYDINGAKTSIVNSNKIMSFENQLLLYTVKNNENKYQVFNKDNVLISENMYKYVYFGDSYFLVVNENDNIDILNMSGSSVLNGNYYNVPQTYGYGTTIKYNDLYFEYINNKIVFKLRSDTTFANEILLS